MPIKLHRQISLAAVYVVSFLILIFIQNGKTKAHELIPDKTHSSGAVLHFTPNDDPTAGAVTGIYYEVQSDNKLSDAVITLTAASSDGGIRETLPTLVKGDTISSSFVFPIKGTYTLMLSIQPKDNGRAKTFRSSVAIATSIKGNFVENKVPALVKIGLILTAWGVLILIVAAVKNR